MASPPFTEDYYAILELSQDADIKAIKSSYRRLAKLKHPDKVGGGNGKKATAEMQLLNQAYTILSNQETRGSYDLAYSSIPHIHRNVSSTHNVRTSQSQQSPNTSFNYSQTSSPKSGTYYTGTQNSRGQKFAQEERIRHENARAEAAKRAAQLKEMEKKRNAQREQEAAEFRLRAEQARKEAEERRAEHRRREEEERRRHVAQREKDLFEKQRQAQLEREQAMQDRENAHKKKEQMERRRRIDQQTKRLEQLQDEMMRICGMLASENMKLNMLQNELSLILEEIEKGEKPRRSWKAHLKGIRGETQAEKRFREYKEEQLAMSAIVVQDKVDDQRAAIESIEEREEAIKKEVAKLQNSIFLEQETAEGEQDQERARKLAEEYERFDLESERVKRGEGEKRRQNIEKQAASAARVAIENARLRALANELLQTRLKSERDQHDSVKRQRREHAAEFERRRADAELIVEMHRMAEEERQRVAEEKEYLRQVAAEEERLRVMQIHAEERRRKLKAERDRQLQMAAEREMLAAAERLKQRVMFQREMERTARTVRQQHVLIVTHENDTLGRFSHPASPFFVTRIIRQ